jgi:hypothetical protein
LSYWKRVLGVKTVRGVRRARLSPVQVVDLGVAAGASIEVVLGGGERLVVREGVTPELLYVRRRRSGCGRHRPSLVG